MSSTANDKLSPPFHAVIFVSQRTPGDNGYPEESARMSAMVKQQPGFLGMESARGADGKGITVAFFESEEAIRDWGRVEQHRQTQAKGREIWYESYQIYYSNVERIRSWVKPGAPEP
jgi:heme-degrading monooxygenase HmoA